MAYSGYITTLKNVRAHPNADRMLLGDCFGNTVCVGLNSTEGQLGLYLPSDGQVSEEFGKANNLLRLRDADGHSIPGGGYLDPDKRNIKAISLRGVKSDGIFLPIECLEYTGVDLSELKAGDVINVVNGHDICQKYIPRSNPRHSGAANKTKSKKINEPIAPLFAEHVDTSQLAYNLDAFKPGDQIEISLKIHGTSARTAHLPVLKGFKRTLWDKLLRRDGTPIYDWGYVSGTRRIVLENYEGGYYGSNEFREPHSKFFEGKLWQGETVYYEICGYTHTGAPIMATGDTPKDYVKEYGKKMEFSYDCHPTDINHPQSDIYVYRMTVTTPDGNIIEYSPEFMRYRCEMMNVKAVPVMWSGIIPEHPGASYDDTITAGEWIKNKAEMYYDGPDPIGKTHVREGVVVRIVNRPNFAAYKHKNWLFKYVSGIAVEQIADSGIELDADILSEL